MIISNDKYVAMGKESKLLSKLTSSLRILAKDNENKPEAEILTLQFQTLKNILEGRYKRAKSVHARLQRLIADLKKEITSLKDMEVFILTCECVMTPLNQAIENIPSNDREFTEAIAKSYLDIQGEKGLATVISLWDDLGARGSLTAERTEIVRAFATLRTLLEKDSNFTNEDQNIVLTAFTQEFERRAAQKENEEPERVWKALPAFS